jgi:hypothetical protein
MKESNSSPKARKGVNMAPQKGKPPDEKAIKPPAPPSTNLILTQILKVAQDMLTSVNSILDIQTQSLATQKQSLAAELQILDVESKALVVESKILDATNQGLDLAQQSLDVEKQQLEVAQESLDVERDSKRILRRILYALEGTGPPPPGEHNYTIAVNQISSTKKQ